MIFIVYNKTSYKQSNTTAVLDHLTHEAIPYPSHSPTPRRAPKQSSAKVSAQCLQDRAGKVGEGPMDKWSRTASVCTTGQYTTDHSLLKRISKAEMSKNVFQKYL